MQRIHRGRNFTGLQPFRKQESGNRQQKPINMAFCPLSSGHKKPRRSAGEAGVSHEKSGGDLLSRGESPELSSARCGFTSEFGMESGGTRTPWPPDITGNGEQETGNQACCNRFRFPENVENRFECTLRKPGARYNRLLLPVPRCLFPENT